MNPAMDLVYTEYDDIYWSKSLRNTTPTPYMTTGLEILARVYRSSWRAI